MYEVKRDGVWWVVRCKTSKLTQYRSLKKMWCYDWIEENTEKENAA